MPRFLHWLRAHIGGYFWLPCQNCGRYFGGHEIMHADHGTFVDALGGTWSTCPRCHGTHGPGKEAYLQSLAQPIWVRRP